MLKTFIIIQRNFKLAPIFFCFIQFFVLANIFHATNMNILNEYLIIVISILTFVLYFITHRKDVQNCYNQIFQPGYVYINQQQLINNTEGSSKSIKKNEDEKPYIQAFHRHQDMSVVISKRPKSEEEDQVELKEQNVPDPERLEQESSNFNSPKVIKSLNQSIDESPTNLKEQISSQNENQETGNFGSISPPITIKNFELKFQKVQTPGFGNATSENSTKETRSQTLTGKKKEEISKDSQIQINIGDNFPSSTPKSEIPKEEFYVERRYCTICNQEQILRSKHCKQCGKCVACYDHHCPWVGNCVGEKNRCSFYWYLVMQLTQIFVGIIKVVQIVSLSFNYYIENLLFLLSTIIVIFFLIMVFSLLVYHTYLALVNLTTWENVSWYKISYLKDLPPKIESPFSQGILGNLKLYCRISVPEITIWTYNQQTIHALLTH